MSPFNKKNLETRNTRDTRDDIEIKLDELEGMWGGEEEDFSLGHNKDTNDFVGDLEILSMRELDKKPEKEQLRILKTAYQLWVDKASHLNVMLQESEIDSAEAKRNIADMKKEMKGLQTIIRHFSDEFLGQQKLKDLTETGSWTHKMVEPEVLAAMKKQRMFITEVEDQIEKAEEKIRQEMEYKVSALEERVEKYKAAVTKVGSITADYLRLVAFEKDVLAGGIVKKETVEETAPEPVKPVAEIPKEEAPAPVEKKEEPKPEKTEKPFIELQTKKEMSVAEIKSEETHKPHFADFYEEFNSGKKEEKSKTVKKEIIANTFDNNIGHYLESLTENQKVVLRLIGETGVSRLEELMTEAEKDAEANKIYMEDGKINRIKIGNDLGVLREKGTCIENVNVNLSEKGNEKYGLFKLTNVGKQCFKKQFKEDPAFSEIDDLIEEYGNLQKAFVIRDLDAVYTIKGYNRISSDKVDILYEKDGNKLPIMLVFDGEDKDELTERIDSYVKEFGRKVYMVSASQEVAKKMNLMFGNYIAKITRAKAIEMKIEQYAASIANLKKMLPNPWGGMDLASSKGKESPLYPF